MKKLLATTALCCTLAAPVFANPQFQSCKAGLQTQALAAGAAPATVARVLAAASYDPKVIEYDRKQPEFSSTFARYMELRISDTRLEKGREVYAQHRELLDQLTRRYGVPGHYLVSFWGLETNYGGYLGNHNVFDSLTTLACDPRRSQFFTNELVAALQLVDQHALDPAKMESSWAGALGQTQFMPTNYQRFAVDGDGDGRADLWGSTADALSSAANFLNSLGWEPGLRWGREVLLPKNFDWSSAGRNNAKPLSEWRKAGVRNQFGTLLPDIANIEGAIIVPAGHRGPAFVVYKNFNVIMGWNRSEFYAISVGHLADRIAGAAALQRQPPADAPRLRRSDIKAIQTKLNALGFDAGKPDGIAGSGTRNAISQYQVKNGMIGDGFLSREVVAALLPGQE